MWANYIRVSAAGPDGSPSGHFVTAGNTPGGRKSAECAAAEGGKARNAILAPTRSDRLARDPSPVDGLRRARRTSLRVTATTTPLFALDSRARCPYTAFQLVPHVAEPA